MPPPSDAEHDTDDISRFLREHDDIGPESSLWLRPIRQLLRHGKPLGATVMLALKLGNAKVLPVGALTLTERNRLLFWPAWPPDIKMICASEQIKVFDHATLELPSEKIHITAYRDDGAAVHHRRAWRLEHFPKYGLALWFCLLIRLDVLEAQSTLVQRKVRTRKSDETRRTAEATRYIQNLRFVHVSLPNVDGDYLYVCTYIATSENVDLSDDVFPTGPNLDVHVTGLVEGTQFAMARSTVALGDTRLYFAGACPSGRLNTDVTIGFPRSSDQSPPSAA